MCSWIYDLSRCRKMSIIPETLWIQHYFANFTFVFQVFLVLNQLFYFSEFAEFCILLYSLFSVQLTMGYIAAKLLNSLIFQWISSCMSLSLLVAHAQLNIITEDLFFFNSDREVLEYLNENSLVYSVDEFHYKSAVNAWYLHSAKNANHVGLSLNNTMLQSIHPCWVSWLIFG